MQEQLWNQFNEMCVTAAKSTCIINPLCVRSFRHTQPLFVLQGVTDRSSCPFSLFPNCFQVYFWNRLKITPREIVSATFGVYLDMLVTVLHAFPVCTRGKFALSAFYQSDSVDMVDSFERMYLILILISPELNKYFCWVKLTKQWQNLKVEESPKGKLLVCWIQALSSWTYFFLPLLPLPAVCFVSDPLSGFWPWNDLWFLYFPSLSPPDSLTVPSPSSACVRSSMSEYLRHQ